MTRPQVGLVREPETGTRRQEWGTVEANHLRVDRDEAERIVGTLSIDHAGSFNLFYLLRKHYWAAAGAEFNQIAEFLESAYKRMRAINDELAFRIVELGGIPPNTPPTIQDRADVHLEAENLYDLRTSLEGDLEGYATLLVTMREHVDVVEDRGDVATSHILREHLETMEADANEIEQFLEDDTLTRGH